MHPSSDNPTPALRSAILKTLNSHCVTDSDVKTDAILEALTPFLAPAPVEQVASLEKAARSIVHDIETLTRCWIEKDEEEQAIEIVKASIQRHFQSLATEKGGKDSAAPFRLALRIIAGNTSDPVIKKYAHDILQANAARAATGKGDAT